ncbi:MAG: hypothetical protein M0Z27_08010 [Thermaerobacter sp.]|nr:hypothetical protein [Thermaerobacter sp.]
MLTLLLRFRAARGAMRALRDDRGDVLQYALILTLVVLMFISPLTTLGHEIVTALNNATTTLANL